MCVCGGGGLVQGCQQVLCSGVVWYAHVSLSHPSSLSPLLPSSTLLPVFLLFPPLFWPHPLNLFHHPPTPSASHTVDRTWCCMRTQSLFISAKLRSTKSTASWMVPFSSLR